MVICMLTIYHRTGEVGERLFDEVEKYLLSSGYPFSEEGISLDGFGDRYLEVDGSPDGSIILDEHKGSRVGKGGVYMHATKGGLMPEGLFSSAIGHDIMLEMSHGPGTREYQAYLEVAEGDDGGVVRDIVAGFLGNFERSQMKGFYTAVKRPKKGKTNNKWSLEYTEREMPLMDAVIVHRGMNKGVPDFILSGIDAIREGCRMYNMDIRGVSSVNDFGDKEFGGYLFKNVNHVNKAAEWLAKKGVKNVFTLTKSLKFMRPYFLGEDAEQKNRTVKGSMDLNKINVKGHEETVKDIKYSIMQNLIDDNVDAAEYLLTLFKTEDLIGTIENGI